MLCSQGTPTPVVSSISRYQSFPSYNLLQIAFFIAIYRHTVESSHLCSDLLLRCVAASRWVWAGDVLIISCSGLLLWILGDLKASAKPWKQTLKIHFDKHISLGQIKTESNKPSTSGVRAQLFWTSSSGSHNKAPPRSPNFLHFDFSPHTVDTESWTHGSTAEEHSLSHCHFFLPYLSIRVDSLNARI